MYLLLPRNYVAGSPRPRRSPGDDVAGIDADCSSGAAIANLEENAGKRRYGAEQTPTTREKLQTRVCRAPVEEIKT